MFSESRLEEGFGVFFPVGVREVECNNTQDTALERRIVEHLIASALKTKHFTADVHIFHN